MSPRIGFAPGSSMHDAASSAVAVWPAVPPARFDLPMTVVIRRCARADLAALEWFGQFAHHREIIAAAFAAQERNENIMLVAALGAAPVGQIWIDLARRRVECTAFFWALRVFPWLQGRGLGRRLLRAAEQHALAAGCRHAEISAERDNLAALALYAAAGFTVAGELRESYRYRTPAGERHEIQLDEIVLRKPLPHASGADEGS